ncbi:MAG: RodZ domain-containing protein [Solirubrobacterales bacterium]
METGIGSTLREARGRQKIGLDEVEKATRIRLRYLRAMENEEWDVLPGGTYTRSFVRTYASFLGLDGERLAEEYRQQSGITTSGEREPYSEPVASPSRRRSRRRGPSTRTWTAILSAGLIAALVVIGLTTGGEEGTVPPRSSRRQHGAFHARALVPVGRRPRGVSLRLTANAEVWVCLIDASGKRLIDGQILTAGLGEGTFHSASFTVSLGNGEVSMMINGQTARIPATSSPVGYSIGSSGRLERLSEGERPTCG